MKPLLVAAFVGIAALAQLPAAAAPQSSPVTQPYQVAVQTYRGGTIIHKICSPGDALARRNLGEEIPDRPI